MISLDICQQFFFIINELQNIHRDFDNFQIRVKKNMTLSDLY